MLSRKAKNIMTGMVVVAAMLLAPADFLVNHLQTLVDLGFKLTTGAAESLRPSGAQLLQQPARRPITQFDLLAA